MTEVPDTWVQKRSSMLNSNTTEKSTKSVDKELARLKNMGAVSSVWTNKFVQEDTSSAGRRQSYPRGVSVEKSKKSDEDISLSDLQSQYDECQIRLTKAKQEIEFYKDQVLQESEKSKQSQESSQQEASMLWFQCETLKTQFAQTEARLKKAQSDITSYKEQLEEQQKIHKAFIEQIEEAGKNEAASLWFQCETLKTEFAHMEARLKRSEAEIATYKQQLEDQQKSHTELAEKAENDGKDEAASLWFQCETFKTQVAQTEARLKNAEADAEAYKQQLEEQRETYKKALDAMTTKDEAAALWFQCEKLKTEFAQTEARLKKANVGIESYKLQLEEEKDSHKKENAALWFQCETLKTEFAQTEARLKKAQAEIETYKQQFENHNTITHEQVIAVENTENDAAAALLLQYETLRTQFAHIEDQLKDANAQVEASKAREQEMMKEHTNHVNYLEQLIVKQDALIEEYESNLNHLSSKHADITLLREELASLTKEKEVMQHTITFLKAELETGRSHMDLMVAVSTEIQNEFDAFKEQNEAHAQRLFEKKDHEHSEKLNKVQTKQVAGDDLNDQISKLKEALAAKDKVIEGLEKERVTADARIMELKQIVLEKDACIVDITKQNHISKDTPHEAAPTTFHYPKFKSKEMSKVREFIYSTSDDDDDDSDVIILDYSDDEQGNNRRDYFPHEDKFPDFADTVSSPVSSTITFHSTEDEHATDIKQFSFKPAKTRPFSVSSTIESDFVKQRPNSNTRFDLIKEKWPIPPPTPPPSDPLPPLPVDSSRRRRTRSVGRDEAPDTLIYRTSIHQTNELPKIIPLQRQSTDPLRKNTRSVVL